MPAPAGPLRAGLGGRERGPDHGPCHPSLTYDRTLLQEGARFGALELAFPSACAAWPDSLRRSLQAQVNQARPHGFQYEVEHACGFAGGDAVLSSIVNREPPFNFAYLEGYEPVARGSGDSLRVRSLASGEVALQEYSFRRSGFAVRQVFVETPGTVYQLDMLIREAWTDSVARVYESVLSSRRKPTSSMSSSESSCR